MAVIWHLGLSKASLQHQKCGISSHDPHNPSVSSACNAKERKLTQSTQRPMNGVKSQTCICLNAVLHVLKSEFQVLSHSTIQCVISRTHTQQVKYNPITDV